MLTFDPGAMARGAAYFHDGHVSSVKVDGRLVVAQISGTRPRPYTAFLDAENPDISYCTCPVGQECKHLVAVVCTILAGGLRDPHLERSVRDGLEPGQVRALEEEVFGPSVMGRLPQAPPEDVGPQEYVIDLTEAMDRSADERHGPGGNHTGRGARRGAGPEDDGAPGDGRIRVVRDEAIGWRLAFLLEVGDDPGYRFNGWRPMIYLARQYRRKDGEYGRVERIPRGGRVQSDWPAATERAAHLDVCGGAAAAVVFVAHLEEITAPIFVGGWHTASGAQDRPVRVSRLERLDIQVKPVAGTAGGPGGLGGSGGWDGPGEISLAMEVRANQDISIDPDAAVAFDRGVGSSVLFDRSGVLLIDAEEGPIAGLAPLRGPHGVFSLSQAYRLGSLARLAERFPDSVTVSQPGKVRVVQVDPEPAFLISRGHGDYDRHTYYLAISPEGETPPDGFYDGEYRIHEVRDGISDRVIRKADKIVGSRATYDYYLRVWVWMIPPEPPAGAKYPEPLRTGVALLNAGFAVYMEYLDGSRAKLKKPERLAVSARSGLDWFDIEVERPDGRQIDPDLLQQLVEEQAIRDGRILVPLEREDIERLRRILEVTQGAGEKHIPLFNLAAVEEACDLADQVDDRLLDLADLAQELLNHTNREGDREDLALPKGLKAELRPYQREGFVWLRTLAKHGLSGCLADDMGLGKTVQALTLMLHLHETGREDGPGFAAAPGAGAERRDDGERGGGQEGGGQDGGAEAPAARGGFLVIAPVSTLTNWQREANRFAPALAVEVHHGGDRTVDIDFLSHFDLVVTSYATALRDAETLEAIEWRLVCLDEAQFIKNPYARTTGSVKRLTAELRLSLTGTPVENVSTDLWSIMDFLNPGIFGTQAEFNNRFPKRGNADSDTTARRFARLRRMVAPFVLRRTKEAVAPELPPRTETVLTCEMGPEQARFYETLRSHHQHHVQQAIDSGESALIGAAIFTGLLRLRQAALYPEDADERGAGISAAKEAELMAQLTEVAAEGHNALVFSQFVSALKRFRAAAKKAGIATLYLDGSTTGRPMLIEEFQNAAEPTVFFISLKAGGTGINLTAADYVYICDPWWNPQVERQAVDRAHRIGRERPVMVTRLVTAGTVEAKVLELQDQKRRLATDIISENESGLAGASPEELLALFE